MTKKSTFWDMARFFGWGMGSSLFFWVPTTSVACIESVLVVAAHNIAHYMGKITAKIAVS